MEPYAEAALVEGAHRDTGRHQGRSAHVTDGRPVASLLARYEPLGLSQVDAAALMNRFDTKYVLSLPQLYALLASLHDDYRVLEVEDSRVSRYRTLYFDTVGRDLYASHHNGRGERFKVRGRSYLDSGASYLEIKRRTNKGRTTKERIATDALLAHLTPEGERFVSALVPLDPRALEPVLWNDFLRVTLVSVARPERVTFDVDVRFHAGPDGSALAGVAVVEVKQDRLDRNSVLMRRLHALGVRPTGFSKYCVGTAILFPGVKHNRFKPVLRRVHKIMRGNSDAW